MRCAVQPRPHLFRYPARRLVIWFRRCQVPHWDMNSCKFKGPVRCICRVMSIRSSVNIDASLGRRLLGVADRAKSAGAGGGNVSGTRHYKFPRFSASHRMIVMRLFHRYSLVNADQRSKPRSMRCSLTFRPSLFPALRRTSQEGLEIVSHTYLSTLATPGLLSGCCLWRPECVGPRGFANLSDTNTFSI